MTTENPVWPTATITGHRPQHLDPRTIDWITDELVRIALKLHQVNGTTTALSGLALGPDQWWAWTCKGLTMRLHAHIPFRQQPDPWTAAQRDEYQRLLALVDDTTVYGDLPAGLGDKERKRRATGLLFARNDGMLAATAAASGVVVAVLRSAHAGGGTRDTYDKALGLKLPVIRVDPDRRVTAMASPSAPITSTGRTPR